MLNPPSGQMLCLQVAEEMEEKYFPLLPFYKALIPSMRALPLMIYLPPKGPTSLYHDFGKFQFNMNLGGHNQTTETTLMLLNFVTQLARMCLQIIHF